MLKSPGFFEPPLLLALLLVCGRATAAVSVSVADANGQPVEGAVVFVYEAKGGPFKPPDKPYEMDQVQKQFVPHILPILVGGRVRFPNRDDIHHHIYSFSSAKSFELPLYKGEPAKPIVFDKPGVVKLGCNIHDWMNGIILVLPNPYFVKTDERGKAVLNVPQSENMDLAVYHDRLKGSVEETRKPVSSPGGDDSVNWTIQLKPDRSKKPPAFDYK